MDSHDRQALDQLKQLWEPWYLITFTDGTIAQWHAMRCDDGSVFHAKWFRDLHNAVSDNYFGGLPPVLSLIPPPAECGRTNAHFPHGACDGTVPRDGEPVEVVQASGDGAAGTRRAGSAESN